MDAEVRETLSRHGMGAEDIERLAEFEAQVKASKRKPRVKVEHPTLFDF